jgi:DNA-directed RNA polymerase specialized sigma24 family protein
MPTTDISSTTIVAPRRSGSIDENTMDLDRTWCSVALPLRRYFLAHTSDVDLADDLLEQTLARMSFGAFARRDEVIPWAFGIARRLVLAARQRGTLVH